MFRTVKIEQTSLTSALPQGMQAIDLTDPEASKMACDMRSRGQQIQDSFQLVGDQEGAEKFFVSADAPAAAEKLIIGSLTDKQIDQIAEAVAKSIKANKGTFADSECFGFTYMLLADAFSKKGEAGMKDVLTKIADKTGGDFQLVLKSDADAERDGRKAIQAHNKLIQAENEKIKRENKLREAEKKPPLPLHAEMPAPTFCRRVEILEKGKDKPGKGETTMTFAGYEK